MKFLSLLLRVVVFSLINLCASAAPEAAAPAPRFFYEVLPQYGLPSGLFPDPVRYKLSADGEFELHLEEPCYLMFDYWAYYDTKITGKLSLGSITNMSGVLGRAFYVLWVNVDEVLVGVPSTDHTIYFSVGFLTFAFDLYNYVTIRTCVKEPPAPAPASLIPVLELPTAADDMDVAMQLVTE